MQRTPEPELMNDPEQADAYAQADFEREDTRFVAAFVAQFGHSFDGQIVDLGCGPGNITLPLARALPNAQLLGVDGASEMLLRAERRHETAFDDVGPRVQWLEACLPSQRLPMATAQAVVSNSLLHHLHDPMVLWTAIKTIAAPGAAVFIGDLRRPATQEAAHSLVETHAQGDPEVLRVDFYNSLLAAFEIEEIQAQLAAADLASLSVTQVGDRHLFVSGRIGA